MKLALIFLSILVAVSHQQYYRNPRMMFAFPWLAMPFPNQPAFYNNYDALVGQIYIIKKLCACISLLTFHLAATILQQSSGTLSAAARFLSKSDSVYPVENSRNIFTAAEEEGEEFADTQSRIKGISRYRPRPSFQDQQNARFLFNLFASTTGTFNNPLLKTATFTLTQTLSLVSIVNCVPANNFAPGVPPACRRKRSDENDGETAEDDQFPIIPSETLGLIPTALSSSLVSHDRSLSLLSSSKEDTVDEISIENLRDKRFFINKNQFVVSSTATTFAFVNSTVTVTVNLLNPAQLAAGPPPCVAAPAAPMGPQVACVACLPTGYIVCPAAG